VAEILPFRGIRFDEARAGPLSDLVAPPYDVIDPTLQEILYRRSPHNIVRIDLPKPQPEPEPYAGAATTLRDWLERGILRRDEAPAIYVTEEEFEIHGRRRRRTGMVALVRLVELGDGIHPHEHTLSGAKLDRLRFLRATRANIGHVFGLFNDTSGDLDTILEKAKRGTPLGEARDIEGTRRILWAIRDVGTISRIRSAMRQREIYLADGHHRYETALAYMKEHPESPAARYRMMTLVSVRDSGLVILPTHRLVLGRTGFYAEQLLQSLQVNFHVEPVASGAESAKALLDALAARRGTHVFGLCLRGERRYLLRLQPRAALPGAGRAAVWRRLDAVIFQTLILEHALGIRSEDVAEGRCVEYVKDFEPDIRAALEKVESGVAHALFLLNPPQPEEVQAVAAAGERMPQKTTFFYPKVYSGMVMRMLEDNEVCT